MDVHLNKRALGDKGIYKKLYRLAKARDKKARDQDEVKCIKDEEGKRHCVGYLEYNERHRDFGYCRWIRVEEVKSVISKMSRGRATGPDETPEEFGKSTDRAGMEWLIGMFNTAKMPEK
ncbi:hypothetical protein H5410_000903 [Solanum commersonii]|uniref:Uncharacterized protein n=1 Tax=Solanum commersonii TaxID=4109 RepID=A0A9J6AY26_SOLCO|nr:hypothetical protein H5410_000903 [Solanum commersonii]